MPIILSFDKGMPNIKVSKDGINWKTPNKVSNKNEFILDDFNNELNQIYNLDYF